MNPAYFSMKPNQDRQTFLDYCQQQRIPFNKADQLLYEIQKTKETYDVFKVLLDQATAPSDATVKLPNGQLHMGWPSRMDTPQQLIKDFVNYDGSSKAKINREPVLGR